MTKQRKRKRNRSAGQGASSCSKKSRSSTSTTLTANSGAGGHRERRKLARKEARRLKKLSKKLGASTTTSTSKDEVIELQQTYIAEVESRTRESYLRRQELKKRMVVRNLERRIAKELDRLQEWVSAEDMAAYEKEVEQKKSKLKGAARPATEVYPWLYPDANLKPQPPKSRDLLELYKGDFASHKETRLYLLLNFHLACTYIDHKETKPAHRLFQYLEEMDQTGSFRGLITQKIVQGAIENGQLLEARQRLEGAGKLTKESSFLAWDLVLVEYISRHVLEESDNSEALDEALRVAMKLEPGIGHIIAQHEKYEEHVATYATQDELEVKKQVEEMFLSLAKVPSFKVLDTPERYFHRSVSWWRDAEGVFEFLQKATGISVAEEHRE